MEASKLQVKTLNSFSYQYLKALKTIITIPPGAYELKSLSKRINIDEGHITERDYLFSIKPKISTLGSIIEITPGRMIANQFCSS